MANWPADHALPLFTAPSAPLKVLKVSGASEADALSATTAQGTSTGGGQQLRSVRFAQAT